MLRRVLSSVPALPRASTGRPTTVVWWLSGFFSAVPTKLALDVTGTLADLPHRTADWFEMVLRRPLERHEWWGEGQVRATIWMFADTGQRLIQTKGWHAGIGRPDRIAVVRGVQAS